MGSTEQNLLSIDETINDNKEMKINREPIAIIGMSCEFAGGIDTQESFWNVLYNSIDVGSEIPLERFDMNSFAPLYTTNKPYIRRGYFINNDKLQQFDPSFFGITDGEAMSMDPCHRLLLEKFVHLLEDANYPIEKIKGTRTSVFIGQFTNENLITFHRSKIENETNCLGPNLGLYNASARISYHFDLRGPNLTLDTACSSSLQTVQLAVQSLRTGEADYAVAGASNLNYTPETFFTSVIIGAISPDGRSRSYSDDANGYAKGEGVGLVLFKRLRDAIRDNDQIYCVIRDIMDSHDGHEQKSGYNVPSSYGQNFLLKLIYSRNQISLNDIFYIEGHGTGTPVGDPIEANTLGDFFKRSSTDPPLFIGSVKSVIGHTEGAAGIASLMKVILCMKHRMIPPNMNFSQINPKIRMNEYNLHIVNNLIKFPNRLTTIGINNFGFGGNNVHAIVTEWSENHTNEYFSNNSNEISLYPINRIHHQQNILNQNSNKTSQHFVLTFSTKCQQSLKIYLKKFFDWFSINRCQISSTLEHLFLTYLCEKFFLKRTTSFSHRLSFIFSTSEQLENQIQLYLSNETNIPGVILPQDKYFSYHRSNIDICFIYSGQGPQWWAMGRQLLHREFLLVSNNSFLLINELFEVNKEENSNIYLTNIAQPCILSIQIALTSLWLSWGIIPKRIIGHSVGEIAAAFIAGRLTLNEAVQIIYHRSRVQNYNTNQGGRMLALFLSEIEAKKLIHSVEDRVQIAAINSPKSVTLSGDKDILENIFNDLEINQPKIFKSWLKIENAFHSYQMERFNIKEELLQSLQNIHGEKTINEFNQQCSQTILYSTVTGMRTNELKLNGEYWWKNIRNPVLFNHGIQSIFNDMKDINTIPIFIEISPHPVLSTTIMECYQQFQQSYLLSLIQSPLAIYSLKRKENEQQTILSSLFLLFSYFGSNLIDLNLFFHSRIYSKYSILKSIISLIDQIPHYTFNHQIYWFESKDSVLSRRGIKKKHHPLLGYRLWANECQTPTWKNILTIDKHSKNLTYLLEHQIHGDILFPASAFIELVFTAINQILQYESSEKPSITLQNIQFLRGLHLDNDDAIHIETVIIMPLKEFFIYSRRKSPNDSIRLNGISGNDLIINYSDENSLHKYSLKEWSLHCRGLINMNIDGKLISSIFNIQSILDRLLPLNNSNVITLADNEKSNDIDNLYKYFSECGLNFGSQFRSIQKLYRYGYEALSEITIPLTLNREDEQYLCHPTILDGCFQGLISIVPGDFYDTFVPISIDEIILCNRMTSLTSIIEQSNTKFYANQSLKQSIKGLTPEKHFLSDILIFQETNSILTPIMIFHGFKIQNYPKENIFKTIINKIEESNSIYHNNPKKFVPIPQLIEHFCAYQSWKLIDFNSQQFSSSINLKHIWLIFTDKKYQIGKQISQILLNHHIPNENIHLIDFPSDYQFLKCFQNKSKLNIIFNWTMDLPILNQPNDSIYQYQEQITCKILMNIIQSIFSMKFHHMPNIFILTDHAQSMNIKNFNQKSYNLIQTPIIGFVRSIINEYKINRLKLIDLQFSYLSDEYLHVLIQEFYSTISLSLDYFENEEIVLCFHDKIIQKYIPEYSTIQLSDYSNSNLIPMEIIPKFDNDRVNFQLEMRKSHQQFDLHWVHYQKSSEELLPNDVEIQIHCVSLSFRDMLKVRGLHPYIRGYENKYDRNEIMGADFSGIIIRKGSQSKFNLNDRVFGIVTDQSALKSHLICNENNLIHAPFHLTMEELSTLSTYVTVLYSLEYRIQLRTNQTILIHAATSGVGLAFIQYAQMIGANIIATAGTEEKRKFLRENYRIEHVFNSRNLSFIADVRRVAPNGQVNIIINSLSGIFLEKSFELLAPFGHFIELGKRDIYSNSKFSLFPLKLNCTLHIIDLISVQKFSPDLMKNFFERISNLCQNKQLKPITPIQSFDASQIQQAFDKYSQATHWGKFVIKLVESNEKLSIEINQIDEQIQQIRKENIFSNIVCNHGNIVISGGLGGLAIQFSKMMIEERGVKRITLLARKYPQELNQNSSQYQNWIQLESIAKKNHAIIQIIKTDINNYQQVFSVLHSINENQSYPIRGIIHSAMILRDSTINNMTEDYLSEVIQPKIRGAWNLHYATVSLKCPLEFFIMFSSIRNHIPGIGQSNYNAGNHFLDSLAYYRLNYLKLPAISIGLPAISGAGYLHNNVQTTNQLLENEGVYLMPVNYVFQMIEQLQYLQRQALQKTDLFNPIMFVVNWKKLIKTNLSSKLTQFAKEMLKINNDNDNDSMNSSNDNQQILFDINIIIEKIRLAVSKIFGSLNIDRIDVSKSLVQQGMDSLRAVELRGWLLKEMFFDTPLVELSQGMSIHDLAELIQNKFIQKQTKIHMTTTSSLLSNNIQDFSNNFKDTSLIIPLYRSNSKYCLFCIHDIIGLSGTFIQFANQLKDIYQNDCPSIYAFRASGYELNEPFLQSVPIIAEQYILQMQQIQSNGPYYLLGYSFGGILAYEITRQLIIQHHTTIQSLILIDPPISVEQTISIPLEYNQEQFWILKTIGLILSYYNKQTNPDEFIEKILNSTSSNDERKHQIDKLMQGILSLLKTRLIQSTDDQQNTIMAKKIFEVIKAQTIAKEFYTYDLARTSNEFIQINNAIIFTLKYHNQYTSSEKKHEIWTSLLPQLHIENIDGTHQTLLEMPIVRLIIDQLKQMNIL